MDEMVETLKNDVNTTNVFLLTFNGQVDRLNDDIQQMVRHLVGGKVTMGRWVTGMRMTKICQSRSQRWWDFELWRWPQAGSTRSW